MVKGKTLVVAIDKVKPNPWNPNAQSEFMFGKSRNSIKKFGFIDDILVREKGGGFEIIDGEHRWRAAQMEGLEEVSVKNLGKVSDDDAKQLTMIMIELKGEPKRDKLVELLKGLEQSVGIPEMLQNLPYGDTELTDLLKSVNVDWSSVNELGPVVVGDNYAPTAAENAPGAPSKSENEKDHAINVPGPEKLVKAFYAQIERIQRAINPEKPTACHAKEAIEVMVKIVAAADLKPFVGKGSKGIVRRSGTKKTSSNSQVKK